MTEEQLRKEAARLCTAKAIDGQHHILQAPMLVITDLLRQNHALQDTLSQVLATKEAPICSCKNKCLGMDMRGCICKNLPVFPANQKEEGK